MTRNDAKWKIHAKFYQKKQKCQNTTSIQNYCPSVVVILIFGYKKKWQLSVFHFYNVASQSMTQKIWSLSSALFLPIFVNSVISLKWTLHILVHTKETYILNHSLFKSIYCKLWKNRGKGVKCGVSRTTEYHILAHILKMWVQYSYFSSLKGESTFY